MEFYIKQGGTLPILSYEVTEDGIDNFEKLESSPSDFVCKFSLQRQDGTFLIFKKKAEVVIKKDELSSGLFLQYKFSEKETSRPGRYMGQFFLESVGGERFF